MFFTFLRQPVRPLACSSAPSDLSRHSRMFGLGSLNVRSLSPLQLDDFIVEFPDRSLNFLAVCEIWELSRQLIRSHSSSAVDGFFVVERSRSKTATFELTRQQPATVSWRQQKVYSIEGLEIPATVALGGKHFRFLFSLSVLRSPIKNYDRRDATFPTAVKCADEQDF